MLNINAQTRIMVKSFVDPFVFFVFLFIQNVYQAETASTKLLTIPGCERDFAFPGQPDVGPFVVSSRLQCTKECATRSTCVAVNVKRQENGKYGCELFDVGADVRCSNLEQQINNRYIEKENPCKFYGYFRKGECMCRFGHYGNLCEDTIKDCNDGSNHGYTTDGFMHIKPDGLGQVSWVYCWFSMNAIMIQRRSSASSGCAGEDFYKTWDEYKVGFGNPSCDFYAGNEVIHILTTQGNYVLKPHYVLLTSSQVHTVCYPNFKIDDESQLYKIHFDNFAGSSSPSAQDGLLSPTASQRIRDQPFCTKDRDCYGCAVSRKSGWWYNSGCAKPDWHMPIGNFQSLYGVFLNRTWKHDNSWVNIRHTYIVLAPTC